MTTAMMRGYGITQALAFVESDHFDAAERRRIWDVVPRDVKSAISGIKPAEWYPRQYIMHIFTGIAGVKNDDEGSERDLAACGKYMANEATNTFLKLFMKIMTPAIFAKKLPEIWLRDHRGSGHFEVESLDAAGGTLTAVLVGVDGFDHVGPIGIGYMDFCFTAMGVSDLEVRQSGWTIASPCPHRVSYEVTWKA